MQEIIIDESSFSSTADVHAYLSAVLELPEYYGANLDALNDCLADIDEPVCFSVYMNDEAEDFALVRPDDAESSEGSETDSEELFAWFPKLCRSLLRAARANSCVNVLIHFGKPTAFLRLAQCPGMPALLNDEAVSSVGLISCLNE